MIAGVIVGVIVWSVVVVREWRRGRPVATPGECSCPACQLARTPRFES